MKGRGAALARVAALMVVGATIGCGGSLTGNPGTAGTGGVLTGSSDSGRGGRAGTTGAAGSASGVFGEPACPSDVTRGGACVPTDIQLCYKACGPEMTGVKAETCSASVYVEMSGCAFDPAEDYSCYIIPGVANAVCPGGMPQAAAACDVSSCTLCNSNQGLAGGLFLDSGGAQKEGYCVCQAPNAAGLRTWSCASTTAWPCPAGAGCSPIYTGFGGVGGGDSGAAGAGGASGGFGQPACPSTAVKGGPCAATDVQLCYKACGPESVGVKSETCAGGVYAEMSGCRFDAARDYSCYRIPGIANAACAAGGAPQAGAPCTIDACTLCNSTGGLPGGGYVDSAGAARIGYCVCSTNATGVQKWSCASDTAWPCPAGSGC